MGSRVLTPERRKYLHARIAALRRRRKLQAIEYKGGACNRCGYNRCVAALEFHHVDPTVKKFAVSAKGRTMSWQKMQAELDKCELVCANCHREIEYLGVA